MLKHSVYVRENMRCSRQECSSYRVPDLSEMIGFDNFALSAFTRRLQHVAMSEVAAVANLLDLTKSLSQR